MDGAQGHRELVADLEAQAPLLGIADMVRMRGGTPADDTWLTPNKPQVLLEADALGFSDREDTLVDLHTIFAPRIGVD